MAIYKGNVFYKYCDCTGVTTFVELSIPTYFDRIAQRAVQEASAVLHKHPRIIDTRFGKVKFRYRDYQEFNQEHKEDFDWTISLIEKYRKCVLVKTRMGLENGQS